MTKKPKKFVMKQAPYKPKRTRDEVYIDLDHYNTLGKLFNYCIENELQIDQCSLEMRRTWDEDLPDLIMTFPEKNKDFQARHEHYKEELEKYKQWCKDHVNEIAQFNREQEEKNAARKNYEAQRKKKEEQQELARLTKRLEMLQKILEAKNVLPE